MTRITISMYRRVFNLLAVGEIKEIFRYPVKSLAGESLSSCFIETYGLRGDRVCAFYDETKTGWNSFITARTIPQLLNYQAKFIDDGVQVTSAEGNLFYWNETLLAEIQNISKRKISMTAFKAPNPEDPKLMSVDQGSLLIITDSSLRKLEQIWGKSLDRRRFRANLIVKVDEHSFNDKDWIGKQLSIGDAKLQIDMSCERCSLITIDPDTLERDASLLKKVNEELDLKFGLYASVIQPGDVRLGDKLYLTE